MQIYNIITEKNKGNGWKNHPAVKMWRGYEVALWHYLDAMISEWISRGYKNTINIPKPNGELIMPFWFGNKEFHRSHRSNLLRKKQDWYKMFWQEDMSLPYKWPV